MHGAFIYLELNTADPGAAKDFYGSLFGWNASDLELGGGRVYTQVEVPDGPGVGITVQDAVPSSRWLPYVQVANVQESVAKARALGGRVVLDTMPVSGFGALAIVADPSGATFGLWQAEPLATAKPARASRSRAVTSKASKAEVVKAEAVKAEVVQEAKTAKASKAEVAKAEVVKEAKTAKASKAEVAKAEVVKEAKAVKAVKASKAEVVKAEVVKEAKTAKVSKAKPKAEETAAVRVNAPTEVPKSKRSVRKAVDVSSSAPGAEKVSRRRRG